MSPWLVLILIVVGLVIIGGFFVLMFAQLAAKHKNGRVSVPGTAGPSRAKASAPRSGGSGYKPRSKKSR